MYTKIMQSSNLQIRIPAEIDSQIERLAPKSKSAFVREAIVEKIQREKARRMEKTWIHALEKHPDRADEDDDWLKAEAWETQ